MVDTNAIITANSKPSMSDQLLKPIEEFQRLSQTLFLSLSGDQAARRVSPPSVAAFIECDAEISRALDVARTHQIKQRKIETLKQEILELSAQWRHICSELESGKQELEIMIKEGDERIEAIEKAKYASLPYPELLAYAQSLSSFTSAPPNMPDLLPGQPPPPLFFPPFPNEEKMRKGRLNAEAPLGPLGETHSIGRAPTVSPKTDEQPQHGFGANPYRMDHRPQQEFFDLDLDLNPDLEE
ncbi:vitamin-D-receptor interacting mediator subunit 4-domain-containing protein [Thelephora terrestris]|uniref:Mediator of RNA polymerase II transcription subunit 4 n=1 Tax=Thelephora terrestris TaxID=56493 RepID=A0A9P6HDP7_9AGAM|nr:vitamin-D-receptor interacting mediator subunit 4-domain-containing protein [Thelephora terrestris]